MRQWIEVQNWFKYLLNWQQNGFFNFILNVYIQSDAPQTTRIPDMQPTTCTIKTNNFYTLAQVGKIKGYIEVVHRMQWQRQLSQIQTCLEFICLFYFYGERNRNRSKYECKLRQLESGIGYLPVGHLRQKHFYLFI